MNQTKSNPPLDPMAVMRLSSAYWHSSVIHVAQQMDLFTRLADGGKTANELAKLCEADPRGIEMLTIACIGLGLVEKRGDQFFNSALADTFLVKSSPRFQGGIVSMFDAWVPAWASLGEAVKKGMPVVEKQHDKGPEQTRMYIMGMLYRGIPQAELLAAELPLIDKNNLLDVAGGPGIFSIMFCKQNPQLSAKVLDLPQTLSITQEIIAQYHAEDKVSTQSGDYLSDDFGKSYDVVLLSSMINQEGPEVVRDIMAKSYRAMESGGLLIVQEQLLNDQKTGPLLAVLIGLNQLIHTPAGRVYNGQELAEIATSVGFRQINYRALPEPSPFTLLTAIKP
ncbi:MAG: methyltransferase [Gammaproteobacteria bacterium]